MISLQVVISALLVVAISANVVQVHDYIRNAHCKAEYIRFSRPVCAGKNGECYPFGTDAENNCVSASQWQWQDLSDKKSLGNYAPGVNPHPSNRITHNGDDVQKVVWTYVSDIMQGDAAHIYGSKGQISVETLLNTPINRIALIANIHFNQPTGWFRPGNNDTDGCGQLQTDNLPFGFIGNDSSSIPGFVANLTKIHQAGVSITLTMASWCTIFPTLPSEEWTASQFQAFVGYFTQVRQQYFGGLIDGIDFDWEGFCHHECLKGICSCDWNQDYCNTFTPEELAAGQYWEVYNTFTNQTDKKYCYTFPTKSTLQIMTGISYYMKQAGYQVTLVPMSTAFYSGQPDNSALQNLRNEFVKYRMQPYPGGQPIDGNNIINLLDIVDGVLLQWYSGFDAGLCLSFNNTPKTCTCDNVPDADYPNVINTSMYYNTMMWPVTYQGYFFETFPTQIHVRCQACGPNVLLPNGTYGNLPCVPKGEDWFEPCPRDSKGNEAPECLAAHQAGVKQYVADHPGSVPQWWLKNATVNSKCPRGIDCPDWQYEGEPRYSRMLNLFKSISTVIDISKVSIGFETLGVDVDVEYVAYTDPALPFENITAANIASGDIYPPCTQNMTTSNWQNVPSSRCAFYLNNQNWGPKFSAKDVVGFEAAVQELLGKPSGGVGMFTADGMLWMPPGTKPRFWYNEMLLLNQTYQIPCSGTACGIKPQPATLKL